MRWVGSNGVGAQSDGYVVTVANNFRSAGANPPQTVYVEAVAVLNDGKGERWVAFGLGFDGVHYVAHPDALGLSDNRYLGAYKDVVRFVNRLRAPYVAVTTVPWSEVVDWKLDDRHDEIIAVLCSGTKLAFRPQHADVNDIYRFGVKARATDAAQ